MAQPHIEIASLLMARIANSGLHILTRDLPPPPLPDDWGFMIPTNGQRHRCEEHPLVELPLVLVMDVRVPQRNRFRGKQHYIQTTERFAPYWLVGARLIHDHVPYPDEPFRPVSPVEAACIYAQHPYLGSVKSHIGFGAWGHTSVQVYRCPTFGWIVADEQGLGSYNHHAAFCRYEIHFQALRNAVYEPDPSAAPGSNALKQSEPPREEEDQSLQGQSPPATDAEGSPPAAPSPEETSQSSDGGSPPS